MALESSLSLSGKSVLNGCTPAAGVLGIAGVEGIIGVGGTEGVGGGGRRPGVDGAGVLGVGGG